MTKFADVKSTNWLWISKASKSEKRKARSLIGHVLWLSWPFTPPTDHDLPVVSSSASSALWEVVQDQRSKYRMQQICARWCRLCGSNAATWGTWYCCRWYRSRAYRLCGHSDYTGPRRATWTRSYTSIQDQELVCPAWQISIMNCSGNRSYRSSVRGVNPSSLLRCAEASVLL